MRAVSKWRTFRKSVVRSEACTFEITRDDRLQRACVPLEEELRRSSCLSSCSRLAAHSRFALDDAQATTWFGVGNDHQEA